MNVAPIAILLIYKMVQNCMIQKIYANDANLNER